MPFIFLSECRRKEQISKPVLLSRTCQVVSQKKREKQKETRVGRSGGYLIELGCSLRRSLCCENFVPLPHEVPIQVTSLWRIWPRHDVYDLRNLVDCYETLRIYLLYEKLHVLFRRDNYISIHTKHEPNKRQFFINFTCFYNT